MLDGILKRLGLVRRVEFDRRLRNVRDRAHDLRARFDAAATLPETQNHWVNADSLAADAAASSAVREIVRKRARYERFNNPYLCGALRTLANDVVGIGPALQMQTPIETFNSLVEEAYLEWSDRIGLARKLRMMREVAASDGEIFGRIVRNRRIKGPVKLDLQLIEADQCQSPGFGLDDGEPDGMRLDADGNVISYWFLKRHPGATGLLNLGPEEYYEVPAAGVIHYYRQERPGQHRGIPEVVSSLNLHAQRRGYRESVMTAARAAACLGAIILESQADSSTEEDDDAIYPFSEVELAHGMMTTAPYGYKANQMRPEQPSTTYAEFNRGLINEQARPLNMPYNVAAADSSDYNYASGRLDHQTYDRSVRIEQSEMELIVLRPLIQEWALDASLIDGFLPSRVASKYLPTLYDRDKLVPCTWIWGERDHIDPTKNASATSMQLNSFMTTRADEYARKRKDWRTEFEQAGKEREALDEAGLLSLDPQLATRALDLLKSAAGMPVGVVENMLTLLGVPAVKAKAMAGEMSKASPVVPPAPVVPDDSVGRNGNGVRNGGGRVGRLING